MWSLRILPISLALYSVVAADVQTPLSATHDFGSTIVATKVSVHLGVMSRCPDAMVCETVFDSVIPKVTDKIELSLLYIARTNSSDPDFGVTCKHGPQECAGNIQQLCVAAHSSFDQLWEFVHCSKAQGTRRIGLADVAFSCAAAAGIQWTGSLAECAGHDASGKSDEGISLLKASASKANTLGIMNSCTVLINEKPVCVRDTTWRDCKGGHSAADFVRQIVQEYDHLNEKLLAVEVN